MTRTASPRPKRAATCQILAGPERPDTPLETPAMMTKSDRRANRKRLKADAKRRAKKARSRHHQRTTDRRVG